MVKLINKSKLPVYNILVPHWVVEYGALGCTKVDILPRQEVDLVLPPAPQIDPQSWIDYYSNLSYLGIDAEGLDSIGQEVPEDDPEVINDTPLNEDEEVPGEVDTPSADEANEADEADEANTDTNVDDEEVTEETPAE